MDKNELIQRLMKTFIVELEEYVTHLNRDLIQLERGPDPAARTEIFKSLFRTGHSLKGTARSMGVDTLAMAGHHLESLFGAARDGAVTLDRGMFEVLFAAADGVRDAAQRLGDGGDVAKGPLAALLPRLETAARPGPAKPASIEEPPLPAAPALPEPSPPPPPAAVSAPVPATDGLVHISTSRLDRLIALGGELRVAQGRSAARDNDLERLRAMTQRWQVDWRAAEKTARDLARNETANPQAALALATRAIELGKENIQWLSRQLEQLGGAFAADRKALDHVTAPLDREVMRARMAPFGTAMGGLDRTVRDIAHAVGKDVDLVLDGAKIEIDRLVVAAIKDPIIHLLRNAIDHGLESPDDRVKAGKPARGRITLAAALRQGMVEISITDDGRGFDLDAIRAKARAAGLAVPDDDAAAARLAFAHGFSTAKTLSDISGRGVGLDVVKTAVESQRGTVDIAFVKGQGTRFTLTVPLTLTRLHALLVKTGGRTYAFDGTAVRGLKRVDTAELRTLEGRDALLVGGAPVPIFRLTDLLGFRAEPAAEGAKLSVAILGQGADRIGIVVDQLLAEHEVVVKDLGPRLPRIGTVAGATILPSGEIALILNAADLLQTALGRAPAPVLAQNFTAAPVRSRKRLLVADDSVTTRTLVKSILETSGFDVVDAADGMAAWQLLQEKGADLVVSDVEMPRMDGFALTEAIRGSKRLGKIPVILVTALETEKDKMRGLDAGADAYLPKSTFDQTNLLEAIERLI